jgi:hypothetical protein
VAGNDLYGGPYGWSGSYTFDTTCSGRIDLDLLGSSRTVRPVHVSGRFAAPRG